MRMNERGIVGEGGFAVDHGRVRLDIGPHQLGGIGSHGTVGGEHHRDRFTDEAHSFVGDWGARKVGVDRYETLLRCHREIGGGPHCVDAGNCSCIAGVHRNDPPARHGRGDVNRVQYRCVTWGTVEVHTDEVGHVAGAAGEQTRVFGAGHSGAQD